MPPEYARAFDRETVQYHASLVQDRAPKEVRVALCNRSSSSEVQLCVITEDEPGLLSVVCAALVTHQLDIRSAQIFARKRSGHRDEAIDFFWVRPMRPESPFQIDEARVQLVQNTLTQFLGRAEPTSPETSPPHSRRTPTVRPPAFRAQEKTLNLYFEPRALAEGRTVLIVEAPDTERLLLTITRTIAKEKLDILASEISTQDDWVHDSFTLADQGAPLTDSKRDHLLAALQQSLLTAKLTWTDGSFEEIAHKN